MCSQFRPTFRNPGVIIGVKLLWFLLRKYWIRQSLTAKQLNREQRRYFQKKQYLLDSGTGSNPVERTKYIYGDIGMADLALNLTKLKPHKRLFFQQGFQSLSLMKQAV